MRRKKARDAYETGVEVRIWDFSALADPTPRRNGIAIMGSWTRGLGEDEAGQGGTDGKEACNVVCNAVA